MTESPAHGSRSHRDRLLDAFDFALDGFQRDAVVSLDEGRSVLVAAPTGSGKTVVAEYAIADALDRGLRAFYTTPIKALSNQKFTDLRARYGTTTAGLLTGDNSIEPDASVVVMTTEVLRNMIYAGRDLDDLGVVVLDEVHYLQDSFRGPVWEEVIVHLPDHVQLVCLSATVSNAEEIGEWLSTVRGHTDVIVEESRPVTLDHTYLVGDKNGERIHHLPMLVDGRPNPEASKFDVDRFVQKGGKGRRSGGRGQRRRWFTPSRLDVVDLLSAESLLPAIVFIFSRAGCDDAVRSCVDAGLRLTDSAERLRIREIADAHLSTIGADDLDALGFGRWMAGLEAGFAAHHAGHVPPMKEAVEACFTEGLVKVVFATETLALGINMPAKAVVIERLTKFNGERRQLLTPGEYTQLAGRAGRRGIDDHGTSITLWSPFQDFGRVAGLASSRLFVLRSAFRPTYNMAVNLVRRHQPDEARRLLNQSLAQFQADRAVVKLERRRRQRAQQLADAEAEATCDRGSVDDYIRALDQIEDTWGDEASIADAVAALTPGDVIRPNGGPRVVVVSAAYRRGSVRIQVVDARAGVQQYWPEDFDDPPEALGHIDLPTPFVPQEHEFRRAAASRLSRARTRRAPARPEPVVFDHPVADCPDVDDHVRAHDRAARIRRDLAELDGRIGQRTGTLGRQFEQVVDLLDAWGYLDGWALTDRGSTLARVYHESDLLVAESIVSGLFDELDAPELAAVASGLVYEHRAPGPAPAARYPSRRVRERLDELTQTWKRLERAEADHGLPLTRSPDHGFAELAHEWCAAVPLGELLDDPSVEITGGDFVRNVRQLIDLVRQIGQLAPDPQTARTARRAADALARGVVAASSVDDVDGDPEVGPTNPSSPDA